MLVHLLQALLVLHEFQCWPKKNKSALAVSCYTKDPDSASPHCLTSIETLALLESLQDKLISQDAVDLLCLLLIPFISGQCVPAFLLV